MARCMLKGRELLDVFWVKVVNTSKGKTMYYLYLL